MNKNDLLVKLSNNKVLLFIIPNLICFYQLFYYYNQNFKTIGAVLFYEVTIGCLVFFIINVLVYLFLKKALKEPQKIFCVMCFISLFYFKKMSLIYFLIFVIFILFLILDFKHLVHFSLDGTVGLISFIVIILFSFTFFISIYDVIYLNVKSKSYNYEMEISVDQDKDTPNIYWIHCDGMMSQDVVKKYYHKDVQTLSNYFEKNGYYYNSNASLIAGHSTQRTLVAMFNPYYYDNFYKDYLLDLEKTYLKEKSRTNFIVNYYELEEKRLYNELFQALKQVEYETVAIADYSSYTAFYVDKYYDFFYYDEDMGFSSVEKEFRYIEKDNSTNNLFSYLRFNHIRPLFYNSLIYPLMEDINFLNYTVMDYDDIDLSGYPHTQNTDYWFEKAIFKGIEDSYEEEKHQFTFIDFKNAHVPFIYNVFGEFIETDLQFDPRYYLGNYIYSSQLLLELLDYIQEHDENAVIVVQGDHGIHTIDDETMKNKLNINQEELQEIRNSVINAVYVPEKYRNGDEEFLSNPLNISRYLVNNYVGKNYEYVD